MMISKNLNFSFPNPSSLNQMNLINLNNTLMMILTILVTFTIIMLPISLMKKLMWMISEDNKTETFWTSLPCMILLSIAFPSIYMLYSMEESSTKNMNILVKGNQWFWSYEYPQMSNSSFNSFMSNSTIMRCLKTSNPLVLPSKIPISFLISSTDVIHSFSMTSTSSKLDAIPGRVNMMSMEFLKSGVITGQCSEICGMNHSFMPIMINVMNLKKSN